MYSLQNAQHADSILMRHKKYIQTSRSYTDRYWSILFVVALIVWITSLQFHYKTNGNTTASANNLSDEIYNAVDYKNVTANTSSEFALHHLILNSITWNINALDAEYQKIGAIRIWMNLLFSVSLIVYSISSMMRSDYIFCSQIDLFGDSLMLLLLSIRGFMYYLMKTNTALPMHFDGKVALWLIPEAIYIYIALTKKSPKAPNADLIKNRDGSNTLIFRKYIEYVMWVIYVFGVVLMMLMWELSKYIQEISWNNLLFYTIAGGGYYLAFALFQYGLMVIAYITNFALDNQKATLLNVLHAVSIVGRFHFGTACYHATLIFPRIQTAFVIKEAEFTKIPNFSAADRFYVTEFKIHSVSPILTAIQGYNHSESTRELIRLFINDSSKVKRFQGFAEVCRYFFILLIGANNLILTLLWSQGAIIDPLFPRGTWAIIFTIMITSYSFMRAFDAILDTIWLRIDNKDILQFQV